MKDTKIKIKTIPEQRVEVFHKNESVGLLNYVEFLDLRVQIKEHQESGYYCMYENQKIKIDKNGELSDYPRGFFDEYINLLMKLC